MLVKAVLLLPVLIHGQGVLELTGAASSIEMNGAVVTASCSSTSTAATFGPPTYDPSFPGKVTVPLGNVATSCAGVPLGVPWYATSHPNRSLRPASITVLFTAQRRGEQSGASPSDVQVHRCGKLGLARVDDPHSRNCPGGALRPLARLRRLTVAAGADGRTCHARAARVCWPSNPGPTGRRALQFTGVPCERAAVGRMRA